MTLQPRIERVYRVRFDEAGADGWLRASGFLRYAQDLAWLHSESAGFGRAWYRERGLTWLIRSIELELVDDAAYGTELSVSTEVTGFRRVWARRRNEFTPLGSEQPVAIALTDWVLLNADGRLVRPPTEIVDAFGDAATFTPIRVTLPEQGPDPRSTEIRIRLSDIDPMAHVNNAAYLDYVDELVLDAAGDGRMATPRRYRAEFVQPAEPESVLFAKVWGEENVWWLSLDESGGQTSFRASLEISPSRLAGG